MLALPEPFPRILSKCFILAAGADVYQRVSARTNTLLPWKEASQSGRREEDAGRAEKMEHQSCGEGMERTEGSGHSLRNASFSLSDIVQNLLTCSHRHKCAAVGAVMLMLLCLR